MTMFANLTDEQLVAQMNRTADACVRVIQMSDKERNEISPKRGTSPNQAGIMSAWFTKLAMDECISRGIYK